MNTSFFTTERLISAGIVIVVGALAFFGGMHYGKAGEPFFARSGAQRMMGGQGGEFANRFQEGNSRAGGNRTGGMMAQRGGMVGGEVIAKDATSVTLKMPTGSTSIVLLSPTTEYSNTVVADVNAITIGQHVVVAGDRDASGAVTAKTVTIRPVAAPVVKPVDPAVK